ncbi:MAG: NAD(P)H-dependent oxidoreductase [Candidatus Xenobiia bacterium LiM19]
MKIAVINGSPKGEKSLTLLYIRFIEKHFPAHQYDILHIGSGINKLEKDADSFAAEIDRIRASDLVVWTFPVYFFHVPSQLKRFAEQVFERNAADAFKGKYATAFTTSAHVYDHTAHAYIHGISEDMGMKYVRGYSADMDDLMNEDEREKMLAFAELLFTYPEEKRPVAREYPPVPVSSLVYEPGSVEEKPKTGTRKVVLLHDAEAADSNLAKMIDTFVKVTPNPVEVINLHEVNIKGGCLSCYHCVMDNVCPYKDDFVKMFREKLMPADALVLAMNIKDRHISSRWKMYYDRSFFNGHCPVLHGKATGYIISGPVNNIPYIKDILQAFTEVGEQYPVGMISDDGVDSAAITELLKDFSRTLIWAVDRKAGKPMTFLGLGAHKVLRDLVYEMSFVFRADNIFYKAHGLYDYPQNNVGKRLNNLFMQAILTVPQVRDEFAKCSKDKMLEPYLKILQEK